MGYGLVVRFTLRDDESARQFDSLVEETLPHIQSQEPGTLIYTTHVAVDDPLARIFYELYVDEAAFEAHENQPHVRRFLKGRETLLAHTEVTFLHERAGKRGG